eukprot:jgi/Botrbrau1/20139/Bobra.0173s0041.1
MISEPDCDERSVQRLSREGRRGKSYSELGKGFRSVQKEGMDHGTAVSGVMEITAALEGQGAFPPRRGGTRNERYLGNLNNIARDKESIFLMFSDPVIEKDYNEYLSRSSRRGDLLSLSVSTTVALVYLMKGDFHTVQARLLRTLVLIGIVSNLTRLFIILMAPALARPYRRAVVLSLSWYSHIVMACLPPLSYGSIKTPSSSWGAYWVIVHNSRFLQNLFAMGLWSPGGFLPALMLLTVLLYSIMHWNQEECEILCSLQPQIAAHYFHIYEVMPAFLRPSGNPVSTVAICVACRQILQVLFGCALPIVLGLRRELASRTAFAQLVQLPTRSISPSEIVMQVCAVNAHLMAAVALLTTLFTMVPQLDHLPSLLQGGKLWV